MKYTADVLEYAAMWRMRPRVAKRWIVRNRRKRTLEAKRVISRCDLWRALARMKLDGLLVD